MNKFGMTDRCQVKFEVQVRKGSAEMRTVYGYVDDYHHEAEEVAKNKERIVLDAILPTCYAISDNKLVDIPFEYNGPNDKDEYTTFVDTEHKKAMKISDERPSGSEVGALMAVGVADGRAWYVVTKQTGNGAKTRVKLEWRGFCPDRYQDRFFGLGKTVALKDVKHMLARRGQYKDWR